MSNHVTYGYTWPTYCMYLFFPYIYFLSQRYEAHEAHEAHEGLNLQPLHIVYTRLRGLNTNKAVFLPL